MSTQLTLEETLTKLECWWAIRITVDSLELRKTFAIFESFPKVVVSEEGDGMNTRLHHHIILPTNKSSDEIKKLIRVAYPDAIGNKCIYVKPSRDKRSLMKYTLKEGNYLYKGFTDQFIKDSFKCSSSKTDLKKEIDLLEEKVILQKITMLQFIEAYIDLKVKYSQDLRDTNLKPYFKRIMIKSGYMTSKVYAQRLYDQVVHEIRGFDY